jgi:hypothetical protein
MPRWRRCGAPRGTISFNKARRSAGPHGRPAFFPLVAAFRLRAFTRVPLDEFLPEYHFNEVHSTHVAAAPGAALAAARSVTPREVPGMIALLVLRTLPRLFQGERLSLRQPLVDQLLGAGFLPLADREDEVVYGVVGRFWRANSDIRRIARGEFTAFREPGFAKAVIDFRVEPAPGGSVLTTETRIAGTDSAARRTFGRYWRVVHPGSALIRREWLRAIRRRAERG